MQPTDDWYSSGIVVCYKENRGSSASILDGSRGRPETSTVGAGNAGLRSFAPLSAEVVLRFITRQLGLFGEFQPRRTRASQRNPALPHYY